MSYQWSEEALAAFQKRAESWRKEGTVRTHVMQDDRPRVLQLAKTKYRNKSTEHDGIVFASHKEAKRWKELNLMQKGGAIRGLDRQVKFPLIVNGVKVCTYIADFVYQEGTKAIVEDAKGYRTREYNLKRKLMKACHGVEILET